LHTARRTARQQQSYQSRHPSASGVHRKSANQHGHVLRWATYINCWPSQQLLGNSVVTATCQQPCLH
jgi:hypothetical protein